MTEPFDEAEHAQRRSRVASAPLAWHLAELRTLVRLDAGAAEVHERRRIVAARDGLREVMAWLDLPGADRTRPALDAEIMYGGRLVRREEPGGTRFRFMVQLPVPLAAGESHEYEMLLRPAIMRPYYVFSPECQCDQFDLRVRFDPDRLPAWIRRVDGETVRMFDAAEPGGDLDDLDGTGEAHFSFPSTTMYKCYGARWQI